MPDHRRSGFTLVELAVAIAMSLVIVGTAVATVRVAATTITKARRMSLENGLLRAGVLVAMDDADLWMSLDDPNDVAKQRLRAGTLGGNGLPLQPGVGDGGADVTDQWLMHKPETFWRGFGYYNIFLNGDWAVDRTYGRWGDYALVANADGSDYRAKQPAYQRKLVEDLGYFGALESSTAATNWWWYEGAGVVPRRFSMYRGESNDPYDKFAITASDQPIHTMDDGERMMVGDRRALTNTGIHFLTSANLLGDPADPIDPLGFQHAWMVSKATIGDGGDDLAGLNDDIETLNDNTYSATHALRRGKVHYPVVASGDVPEDWPRVDLKRIGWYLRGTSAHWIRVTVTDPLTGRQMALSLDATGSTLYGIRVHRGLTP